MEMQKKKQWCIVQFKDGGTEIVPCNWLHGKKLSWPPFNSKDPSKIHAAVKNCINPGDGWIFYEPVRHLITRDSYEEAQRSLNRYLKEHCDTTDMQSEEEFDGRPRRKLKPNPVYCQDAESDEEAIQMKKKKFAPAPRILPVVGPSPSSNLDAALIQEKDHCKPHLHQPVVKHPDYTSHSNDGQGTSWNDIQDGIKSTMRSQQEYYDPLYESQSIFHGRSREDLSEYLRHGQGMESPGSRQIIKEIVFSKMSEPLAELVTEVKELRQEVQSLMRRQHPIALPLPMSLPLKDLPQFEEAERILQGEEARRVMMGRFAIVGGASVEARIRRRLACTLTNDLASQMNWTGKKVKDIQKQKTAFKDTNLQMCMFDALQQQLKAEKREASEFVFAATVQKWLRYAPERLGGIARRKKL